MRARASLGLLVLLVTAAPRAAIAWESRCYAYPDPSLEPGAYAALPGAPECTPGAGPDVVRARWIGPLDEHRRLFDASRRAAGVPDAVAGTIALRVFTSGALVTSGAHTIASLRPVAFEQAARAQTRYTSVAELAELPDFAYGLWDWAAGAENHARAALRLRGAVARVRLRPGRDARARGTRLLWLLSRCGRRCEVLIRVEVVIRRARQDLLNARVKRRRGMNARTPRPSAV